MSRPKIAIALGDPAGIGPEIALKAALDPRVLEICEPILVGDAQALAYHAKASQIDAHIHSVQSAKQPAITGPADVTLMALDHFSAEPLRVGKIAAAHGRSAIESARVAIEAAMAGGGGARGGAPPAQGHTQGGGHRVRRLSVVCRALHGHARRRCLSDVVLRFHAHRAYDAARESAPRPGSDYRSTRPERDHGDACGARAPRQARADRCRGS